MGRAGWIIGEEEDRWVVWRIAGDGHARVSDQTLVRDAVDEQAEQLATILTRHGYRGEGVLMWAASSRCLVGVAQLAEHRASGDRIGIGFDFETVLPLSTEEFIADYVVLDRGVLGVALEVNWIVPWVEALERRGIVVQAIVPKSLLALQGLVMSGRLKAANLVLWRQAERVEIFGLADEALQFWEVLDGDAEALTHRLALVGLARADRLRVATIELPDGLSPSLSSALDAECASDLSESMDTAACVTAAAVLQDNCSPWIDFRREALPPPDAYRQVRGPLRFAMASAAVCLVVTAVALYARARYYDEQTLQYQQQQASLFEQALPGQPAPIGVRSRLESEFTKLAGVTGQQSDLPKSESALIAFQETIAALPTNLRFRLLELRVDPQGRIQIDAEVRTHGDTATIAAALKDRGLEIASPQSRQLSEGVVSVQIQALFRGNVDLPKENPT